MWTFPSAEFLQAAGGSKEGEAGQPWPWEADQRESKSCLVQRRVRCLDIPELLGIDRE